MAGERSKYQAISSPLCPSSEPASIVDAFLQLAPFDTIYIADLNALAEQWRLFRPASIHCSCGFRMSSFWIDAAFDSVDKLHVLPSAFRDSNRYWPPKLSTRSNNTNTSQRQSQDRQYVLSLDHKGGRLGPDDLFIKPELWPKASDCHVNG